jgi:hypothetical protein
MNIPCPCCGFLTLEDFYGSYNICCICNWEDDGIQLSNPTSGNGANSRSLIDAQARAIHMYPINISIEKGIYRSQSWRPLNADEIFIAEKHRKEQHWYSAEICLEKDTYWQINPKN